MQYCLKCRCVCEDNAVKCGNCGSNKLRLAEDEDMVLLCRADQYTAQQLRERMDAAGIACEEKPANSDWGISPYDSEAMPTDRNVYVKFSGLSRAKEISSALRKEQEEGEEEQFEDMPRKKRILVQVLSILGFLVLVMLAVYGADALANWLKSVFGL